MSQNCRPDGGALRRGLPYVDNVGAVLLTAAVNLACVFIFYFGRAVTLHGVLTDSFWCGVITPFICVCFIAPRVAALRREGLLPALLPKSRLMSALPKNRFLLALLFAAVFGFLMPAVTLALVRFYGITGFGFAQLAVWKLIYSVVLSVKITELTVLRYVQPDCAEAGAPDQHGSGEVRDPLPRVSIFKEWFATAANDFGLNMIIGLLLGGTIIEGYNVVILPTERSGTAVTSVIFGLIVTVCMAYPVAKSVRDALPAPASHKSVTVSVWTRLLPESPKRFAAVLAVPIIILSYAVFMAVMSVFRFEELNFFQFFVIRTVFVSLLAKAAAWLAVKRYIPADGAGSGK